MPKVLEKLSRTKKCMVLIEEIYAAGQCKNSKLCKM